MSADNDFNTKYRISGPAHAHYHHEGLEVVPQQLNDTLPEVVPSDAPELNSIQAQSFQKDEYTPATAPSESRRILGFPRRAFLLTVLATVLVVCAVVAGVVGGIFSRLNASTSSQATQQATATATSNLPDPTSSSTWRYIHPNSTITATNYTDSNGRSHRAVFFQDSVGAIIGRFWDDQNKTWESLNMTNALPNRGPVLSGSPLTSSAITLSSQPNRIAVWFLWENLSIDLYQWIGSADDSVLNSAQWEERITLNDAILYAQAGTSMASAWQPPFSRTKTTSIGYWILAYQNDDGNIMAANYSSTKSVIAVESPLCSAGTSIAMDVERSASVTGLAMMTYQYDGEVIRLGGTSETWEHPSDAQVFNNLDQSSRYQLAQTPLLTYGQYFYLALLPNGTVTAAQYNESFYYYPSVDFSGYPDNPNITFTAIATTSDAMFYGIYNDTILEFSIDETPYTTSYGGVVYP